MTLRIHLRTRPRVRWLLERLRLVACTVELEAPPVALRFDDSVAPFVGQGGGGASLGTFTVRSYRA